MKRLLMLTLAAAASCSTPSEPPRATPVTGASHDIGVYHLRLWNGQPLPAVLAIGGPGSATKRTEVVGGEFSHGGGTYSLTWRQRITWVGDSVTDVVRIGRGGTQQQGGDVLLQIIPGTTGHASVTFRGDTALVSCCAVLGGPMGGERYTFVR